MKVPKPIVLYDFIKKLEDSGLDLSGCNIQCREGGTPYSLIGIVGSNVRVKYGPHREFIGHMTRGITVTGISLQTKSGKKIFGAYGKSESIVIQFTEHARRR